MLTDKDIAREYILMRVSVESAFTDTLGRYLDDAVSKLVRIAYRYGVDGRSFRYGMNPLMEVEIDGVIEGLLDSLYSDSLDYASVVADEGEDGASRLLGWTEGLYDDSYGSYRDGLSLYVDMFGSEVESLIAACMLLGYSEDDTIVSILSVRKNPWGSDLWRDALVLAGVRGVMATILRDGGIHLGVGRSNVSFTLLDTYGRGFIASAWMRQWYLDMGSDARYFRSITADGTACSECKANEERGWQGIESYPEGAWHPNCRCSFVFASADEVEG